MCDLGINVFHVNHRSSLHTQYCQKRQGGEGSIWAEGHKTTPVGDGGWITNISGNYVSKINKTIASGNGQITVWERLLHIYITAQQSGTDISLHIA